MAPGLGQGYHAWVVSNEGARIPPHNEDAERSVIGALLLAANRIPEVAETLRRSATVLRAHKLWP